MTMDIRKEMIRKLRIRNQTKKNMLGGESVYQPELLTDEQIEELNQSIYKKLLIAQENSFIRIHGKILQGNKFGKLIVIVKKCMRKMLEKAYDWYYFPVLDRQNIYNKKNNEAILELQRIVSNQKYQIDELKKILENSGVIDEKQ